MAAEAETMQYARQHGYPVPAIDEVSDDGQTLVMERVDGPSLVALMSRRPWTISRQGRVLAELHRQLHEIPAPPWLAPAPGADGDRLLHLDLHPLNVIVGRQGPVVIDWTNAARGDGDVDVALAWLLMACGQVPFGRIRAAVLGRARSVLVDSFLKHCDVTAARRHLSDVVAWKLNDPHMSDIERNAMTRLASQESEPDR